MNRHASTFAPFAGDLTRTNRTYTHRRNLRWVTALPSAIRTRLPRWETTERDRAGLRVGAIAGTSFVAGALFVASLLVV